MKKRLTILFALIILVNQLFANVLFISSASLDITTVKKNVIKQLKKKEFQYIPDLTKYSREFIGRTQKEYKFYYDNMGIVTLKKELKITGTVTTSKLTKAIVNYFSKNKKYNAFEIKSITKNKKGIYVLQMYALSVLSPEEIEFVREEATRQLLLIDGFYWTKYLMDIAYEKGDLSEKMYQKYYPNGGLPWRDWTCWIERPATVEKLIEHLVGIVKVSKEVANGFYIGEYRGLSEGGSYIFKLYQGFLEEEDLIDYKELTKNK